MDDYKMPLNFMANLILSFSFTAFIIFLFGRTNSRIYKLPWYKTLLVKIGLCLCTVGSLLNVFTFSDPPWTEVILNSGLSLLFLWAAWFHYRTFVIPYKIKHCKKSKQNKKR